MKAHSVIVARGLFSSKRTSLPAKWRGSDAGGKVGKTDTSSLRRKSDNGWIYPMLDILVQRETKTPNRFVPDMQISISFGREKKKTKRKEKRRKKRRGFGRVLRDRERSIFMLIGAISRISNFSPVKYHRSKVFHEGGNKSHFMEIARPPNNAQLRPPTYSSLFFFSASISTGEWVSVEGEEENYGWKVFMSVDDGNVVASLLCREGDRGRNFFEMILFFRWWLFVKKIGERGRGGYEVFSFFWK